MWEGGGSEDLVNYAKDRAATGFCNRKYLWDYNRATFYDKPMNYSYMRLAEVYLAYAEALNETGRKDEACKWLDKTRNRVGLPSMTDELLHRLHRGKVLPSYPECALAGDAELREEILDEPGPGNSPSRRSVGSTSCAGNVPIFSGRRFTGSG